MATALSLLTIYQHTKGVRGPSPLKLKALQALEIERVEQICFN